MAVFLLVPYSLALQNYSHACLQTDAETSKPVQTGSAEFANDVTLLASSHQC